MHSSKKHLPIDVEKHENTRSCSANDSPVRSYAIIESNQNDLEQIVDLLRQFFPKTRIIEYCNQNHLPTVVLSQQQKPTSMESVCYSPFSIVSKSSFESDINNDQLLSNTNSQIFKGKVKDYLQRRYLDQIRETDSRKESFTKSRSDTITTCDRSSSSYSNLDKQSISVKSHSLDSSSAFIQKSMFDQITHANDLSMVRSPSKRGLLRRSTNIDMDDVSNDSRKRALSADDDDDNYDKTPYVEQKPAGKSNHLLIPFPHSWESDHSERTPSFPNRMSLPLTPYSASSDPGPFHSPWFNTPTSSSKFRFPECQEQLAVNAQGSISQLSTLTKMLCDEPSVFTPVSPRFKKEKHDPPTMKESASIPSCQICRQEFDSHQTYLSHYRTHLESAPNDTRSDSLDLDPNHYDRSPNLRHNHSCHICFKHFSRSDMLNRHLRLHSGTRPYRCIICNVHFSRSDHLSTHFRTHTGEKPYTCPQCSYTACRRDMITRHIKIHSKQRSPRSDSTSAFGSSNNSQ